MTKKYELTQKHKALLPLYKDKWIKNALSTEAMTEEDRIICKKTVIEMYQAANLPVPKNIVFVSSPFILRFASGLADAIWLDRKQQKGIWDATHAATNAATNAATSVATNFATSAATRLAINAATNAATYDATHVAIHVATDDATEDATNAVTNAATYAATNAATHDATSVATRLATNAATYDATYNATHAATNAATYDATYDATNDATTDATTDTIDDATHIATYNATHAATNAATNATTYDATLAATNAATYDATYDATNNATYAATRDATRDATHVTSPDLSKYYVLENPLAQLDKKFNLKGAGIKQTQRCWGRAWQGGNQWSGWCSYNDFFKTVAKLPIDYTKYNIWETLALHSGPRTVYPDFCIISDRPKTLLVDTQNRPHCMTGPYCEWRDGSKLYAVHGVFVPAWIIELPKQITIDKIEHETNAEIRRVMIEIYGVERYIQEAEFEVLDQDKDQFGHQRRLLRKKMDPEDIVRVEVINSTPELDESYKKYYLPVHPKLRPLLSDGTEEEETEVRFGKPQKMTCHNAVASTFGLRGEEYAKPGMIRQGDVLVTFKDGSNQLKFRES